MNRCGIPLELFYGPVLFFLGVSAQREMFGAWVVRNRVPALAIPWKMQGEKHPGARQIRSIHRRKPSGAGTYIVGAHPRVGVRQNVVHSGWPTSAIADSFERARHFRCSASGRRFETQPLSLDLATNPNQAQVRLLRI